MTQADCNACALGSTVGAINCNTYPTFSLGMVDGEVGIRALGERADSNPKCNTRGFSE